MGETVKYTFVALDRFTAVSRRIGRQTDGLKRKLGGLNRATAALGRGFLTLGVAAAGGLTAGLVGAIRAGTALQDSVADLESIAGITGDKLKFLTGEVKRLSRVSIVEAPEVAAAFKVVASVMQEIAQQPEKLSQVTEQVLLLSNATGIDLATATNILTKSMSLYIADASEAARFTNALAAASKVGASELGEAGEAYLKAGVAAKLSKIPFEELLATIQVLAKGGLAGPQAGTLLSSMLLQMEDKAYGGLTPSVDGFTESIQRLGKAYKAGQVTGTQLSGFVGMEGIKALGILLDLSHLLPVFTEKITGSNVATEQAAIRMATFNKRMSAIGISIKLKLVDVFDRLEPKLVSLTEQFEKWLDALTSEDVQQFTDDMLAIANAIATVIRGLGALQEIRSRSSTSIFTNPVGATVGALISKWSGSLDVNVAAEKGTSATVAARSKRDGTMDMGVNMLTESMAY